ncbi:MAG: hypothetical protein MJ096_01575 [Clostridia bacterium]|nr:hypothetical protein [Clostridia bacterium]
MTDNYDGILEELCASFSEELGADGAVKPCAVPFHGNGRCLFIGLSGVGEEKRKYIDGSSSVDIPFDLKLRFRDLSPSDRLDAEAFIENFPLPDGVSPAGSPTIRSGAGSLSECSRRFTARRLTAGDTDVGFELGLQSGTWTAPGAGFIAFSLTEKADTSSHRYVGEDETLTSVDGVAYYADAEIVPVTAAAAEVASLTVGGTLPVRRAGKIITLVCIFREEEAGKVKMKFASGAKTEEENE